MKQKNMHQSSFKSAAIKATIFVASAFFVAHTVFGKPALLKPAQEKQQPDSGYRAPSFIYAKLSIQSRQFLETLRNSVNANGDLPQGAAMSMPALIQILGEWAPKLENDPNLAASLEKSAEGMESWFKRSGIRIYELKGLKMREIAAVLRALQAFPDEQKQLLSELPKTFVVPAAE